MFDPSTPPEDPEVVMFRTRRTPGTSSSLRSTVPTLAGPRAGSERGGAARRHPGRSTTSAVAVALAALLLASCGADDTPSDDSAAAAEAAAPDDDAADQDDAGQDDAGQADAGQDDAGLDAVDQDEAAQDDAAQGEADADEAAGGGGYVHPVATDLALPTEHCELVVHVHGQRQNGSTLVGPIGAYHHDGTIDMDAVPYGILHYENVIAGIEALDDPELATALDLVSTFHTEVAAIVGTGVQGEELAIALADFHYGTDPTQAGDGATLLKDFEQAWQAWVGPQGC